MSWDDFLKKAADAHELLQGDDREAFLVRFAERNLGRSVVEVATTENIVGVTLDRRLGRVYAVFALSCPSLNTNKRVKFKLLRDWLKAGYVRYKETGELPWLPATSNLGVGNKAIASSTSPSAIANTTQKPEEPEDFYVEPPILNLCYNEILRTGCLLRIKAPWRMGKTELMSRILKYASACNYRTAAVSLRDATTTDFTDLNQFLQWFCTSITLSVTQEPLSTNPVEEHWDKSIGNSKNKCKTYFEKHLLLEESPLALALDEVDRVFPYQKIAGEFLGMLRTRHEDAKTSQKWGNFRQVLVYTEDYREIDINQSPFNAGKSIELPELNREQVQDLARQYQLNWDSDRVDQLMEIVGGHAYLVKEAINNVTQQGITLDELLEKAPTKTGIYREHLQRYWQRLQQSEDLSTAFYQVVRADSPVELSADRADKLHDLGLVNLVASNVAIPRYELYRQYFRSRLGST